MKQIIRADSSHANLIATLGKVTFVESHGNAASLEELNNYVNLKFTEDVILDEMKNPNAEFYLMYYNGEIAGFMKIILNTECPFLEEKNNCKLERLYLLKKFYGEKLGYTLYNFLVQRAKQELNDAIWLTVYYENDRAIDFYEKLGFKIFGEIMFKLYSIENPNYVMVKENLE